MNMKKKLSEAHTTNAALHSHSHSHTSVSAKSNVQDKINMSWHSKDWLCFATKQILFLFPRDKRLNYVEGENFASTWSILE